MSDYTKSTDFASKDTLPSGDSAKIVRGTEIDAEFEALEVAIATKANTSDVSSTYAPLNNPTFTGSPVLPTGTTAVTQAAGDNDTSVATTAFVTTAVSTAVNNAGYPSFKNRIINGAMMIDQRNAGASVTIGAADVMMTDRWMVQASQASKMTAQQNAGSVTPPAGFSNYLGITSSSAYSIVSGDYFNIQQRVEGLNFADFAWGTASATPVTISFWVRSSLTGTFGGSLRSYGGTRSYPFTYTISAANTWEQKSITVAGDTTGTWLTNNSIGVNLALSLGTGSTYSGTANAWASANYSSATGATSVVGTSGATFYITGLQLEKGSTATSFDYRPYGTELALCQRYYETTYPEGVAVGAVNAGPVNFRAPTTASAIYTCYFYKATKRTTPTVTFWNGVTGTSGTWRGSSSANRTITLYSGGANGFGAGGGSSDDFIQQGHWESSAEL